jgi:Glycosyl transferase family 11
MRASFFPILAASPSGIQDMKKQRLIVRLKGGLGNQMFQYAAGRALCLQNDAELILDATSGFIRDNVYRRTFQLNQFPLKVKQAHVLYQLPFWYESGRRTLGFPRVDIARRSWGEFVFETDENKFVRDVVSIRLERNTWMEGYWQSENYFNDWKDLISDELAPPEPSESNFLSMARLMGSCNSVAVGVRVYEEAPVQPCQSVIGGITPLSFYQNAANQLSSKDKDPTFFVFCTSLEAVKDKLELPGPVHYLTHDNGYVGALHTLWLISQCKHHIISNSSFYWWGAWMAERRHFESIVIACDLFTNKDTVPQRWTRLHLNSDY